MPHEEYARSVVHQLMKHDASRTRPRYIWEGAKIWLVWIVHTFLPKATYVSTLFI